MSVELPVVPVVLSMLHEGPRENSATRLFRGRPVLQWTVDRLRKTKRVGQIVVSCWDDQAEFVGATSDVRVHSIGLRRPIASMDAVTVAQKWADGWRGGLLQTCTFDRGFHGPTVERICEQLDTPALLLIDPAAGLVDPTLVDTLLEHTAAQSSHDLVFSPAAPGLCGVFLRKSLIASLAVGNLHPGRALHYVPTHPILDPLGRDACAPTPPRLARTSHSFLLDSQTQIERLTQAFAGLNGQLIDTPATTILDHLDAHKAVGRWPRELVLELTPRRATRPVYSAVSYRSFDRADLTMESAESIFTELASAPETRLILSGVGDPLLHADFFTIVDRASERGVRAIAIETDFAGIVSLTLERLAGSPVDVVSVHIPAMTPATYAAVMGVDALATAIENVKRFLGARQSSGRVSPLLVPTFTKLRQNLAEMETWYDQWVGAIGHAVIVGPSDYASQIPDVAVSDVSPPMRRACVRVGSRLTILSDGTFVACEQDVLGIRALGVVGTNSISDVWTGPMNGLRDAHACRQWDAHPLCGACREWHRP